LFGEVNRDTRGKAKTINFAILYGISSLGLAGRLGVDRNEAQAIIDRYFDRFPGINYIALDRRTKCAKRASSPPCSAARRTCRGIKGKTVGERQSAERQAINAPIQGTCADIIKRAMARMGPKPWPRPGSIRCACCSRCMTNWCSSCPRAMSMRPSR
jgi:DNA polymerase-1